MEAVRFASPTIAFTHGDGSLTMTTVRGETETLSADGSEGGMSERTRGGGVCARLRS